MRIVRYLFIFSCIAVIAGCVTTPIRNGVQVTIYGGKAVLTPAYKSMAYAPLSFGVAVGSCEMVNLRSIDVEQHVALRVCYKEGILSVLPQYPEISKTITPIRLFASPLWARVFTYRGLSTSKYPYLHNINIKVKRIYAPTKNSSFGHLDDGLFSITTN